MNSITTNHWETLVHFDSDLIVQVIVLLFCAGIIGLERQLSKKPAGIRTSILIALGSMIFVKYGFLAVEGVAGTDPTRVMGQVVTGIGFLGAGTIMNRDGLVAGLTTASSIWVEAAIGAIIALGYYGYAIFYSILALGILQGLSRVEVWLRLSTINEKKIRSRAGVGVLYSKDGENDEIL